MKRVLFFVLTLFLISCEKEESTSTGFIPESPDPTEIEGTWRGIRDGSHKVKWEFTFYGQNWFLDDECGVDACGGTFELNNTTTPNQINLEVVGCASDNSYIGKVGEIIEAIYQLDIDTTISPWDNSLSLSYELNIAIPDSTMIPDDTGSTRPQSFTDQSIYLWETLDNINPNNTYDEGLVGCCDPLHNPNGYRFESESKYQFTSPTDCSGDSTLIGDPNDDYYIFTTDGISYSSWDVFLPSSIDWEVCESSLNTLTWSTSVETGEYTGNSYSYINFTMSANDLIYIEEEGHCNGGGFSSFPSPHETKEECEAAGYGWNYCTRTFYVGTPVY